MTYFVKMTWQGKPGYSQYDGMSSDDILTVLGKAGATDVTFISEAQFRSESVQPAPGH